jgi:hypothetical protein
MGLVGSPEDIEEDQDSIQNFSTIFQNFSFHGTADAERSQIPSALEYYIGRPPICFVLLPPITTYQP